MPKNIDATPTGASSSSGSTPADHVRIVVKFRHNEIPDSCGDGGVEKYLNDSKNGAWDKIVGLIPPGIKLRPLFTAVKPQKIQELVKLASARYPTCKPSNYFFAYFVLDCPPGIPAEPLVDKFLSQKEVVEKAYIDLPLMDPAPQPFAADLRPLPDKQEYLDEINAPFAWGIQGGRGDGQQMIDLEGGWTLDHQDLLAHHIPAPIHGAIVDRSRAHGTSVLGVICAAGGPDAYAGIAPNATVKVVSHNGSSSEIANAIDAAISNLESSPSGAFGAVLVLEAQVGSATGGNMPCESYPDRLLLEKIQHATAKGIVVVEAAGNAGSDLTGIIVEDSGAIMVGAATAAIPHGRLPSSNFGGRVNCYACGERVYAPSSDRNGAAEAMDLYDDDFGRTSGATAIVAGLALAVQGMAERSPKWGRRFNPDELRQILSNPANGTPSNSPGDGIGVMPDLKKIFENEIA
jgi:hypothetical protein